MQSAHTSSDLIGEDPAQFLRYQIYPLFNSPKFCLIELHAVTARVFLTLGLSVKSLALYVACRLARVLLLLLLLLLGA